MKKSTHGIFAISLDFELYWGIRDKKTIEEYGENVLGAWEVVPRLLKLFDDQKIHATWAVVGAMICENSAHLKESIPKKLPNYSDKSLSPYLNFLDEITQIDSRYLFGNELFNKVKSAANQEIGTHTFSHYYCLEDGQNKEEFLSDLEASINIIQKNGVSPKTFIFPRHQLNEEYIKEFPKYGIEIYRGTEKIWYNSPSKGDEEGVLKRAIRFADYYLKMQSHHCQDISEVKKNELYVIRASRWLRPYSKKWEKLDFLKIRRIKNQMTFAAKNGKIFQLWFHPHDIGKDIDKNFEYLEEIFKHFQYLNKKYNFQSKNLEEIKMIYDESYGV